MQARVEVSLTAVRRWLAAVGVDPESFDPAGPVPPLFIVQCPDISPALNDLYVDGIAADVDTDSWGGRRVAAGDELQVLGPIRVGDVLVTTTEVTSTEFKEGRTGPFLLVTKRSRYQRESGDIVAIRTHQIVVRDGSPQQ